MGTYKYVRLFKNGNRATVKSVKAENIEEAKAVIANEVTANGMYVISSSGNPPAEYEKISLENLKQYKKKPKKKPKIKLSKAAKTVLKYVDELSHINEESLTEDICKKYGLLTDTDKPYYAYCYWGTGDNGSFVDKDDIAGMMADQIRNGDDDNYSFSLFDVKNKCEVVAEPIIDVNIKPGW